MGDRRRRLTRYGKVLREDAHAVGSLLRDARSRQAFVRALRHPSRMTRPQKHLLLLLAFAAVVAVWGIGTVVLRAVAPGLAEPWDLAWGLATWGFLTTVILPLPFEPALFAARSAAGDVLAVLASAVGKTAGALVVFFLGGAIRGKLAGWKHRHPWLRSFLEGTEDAARRWKAPALGAMMAIPLFPDSLPVYLFSLLRLRLRDFLLASFLGVAIRSAVVLALGRATLL